LLCKALATRIILGTVTFAFLIQLLLLIESTDNFLQAVFHFFRNGTGLSEIFDNSRGEKPDRWGVCSGLCLNGNQQRYSQ
jgi:hypothetical protein